MTNTLASLTVFILVCIGAGTLGKWIGCGLANLLIRYAPNLARWIG